MNKLESLIKDLTKANKRLQEAVKSKSTRMNKDATIQRFEFTFELAWKTIQGFIRDQGLDCKSPKSCFRTAANFGLIKNPRTWFEHLNKRNLIAHTYNEKMADEIYVKSRKFPKEIDKLLEQLRNY